MRFLPIALAALTAAAAPPELTTFFPAGARTGTTTEVTASGKLDPWPPSVWVSDPAVAFTPDKETKGKFSVAVQGDVAPGYVLVRFYNAEGVSSPKCFSVSRHPVAVEVEPNNALASPQQISTDQLPLTVEGRLDPGGDVDLLAFQLAAGTTLNASVDAYALGSPVDPLLHIRDATGTRIAFNHDATGATLDPAIGFTAPETAAYTLQLSAFAHPPQANIRFTGSPACVYRLHLSLGPPPPPPTPDEPTGLTFPSEFTGTIATPGLADTFPFTTTAGTHHHFSVTATPLGYPTDPVLRILDADRKALASADDIDANTNLDASLDWKAPADGSYVLEVSDRYGAGSPRHGYVLGATAPGPSFQVTTPDHAWTLKAGGSVEIKLQLTRRHGHSGDVAVTAPHLPEGVSAAPFAGFDKKGAATLTLNSTAEAAPYSGVLDLAAGGAPVVRSVKLTNTDPGDLQAVAAAPLWLTVTAAPGSQP